MTSTGGNEMKQKQNNQNKEETTKTHNLIDAFDAPHQKIYQ